MNDLLVISSLKYFIACNSINLCEKYIHELLVVRTPLSKIRFPLKISIGQDKRLFPNYLDESLTEHFCQVSLSWNKEDCFIEIMEVFHTLHTFIIIFKTFLFTILRDNKEENLTFVGIIKFLINARKIETKNENLNLFSYSFGNPTKSPMSM